MARKMREREVAGQPEHMILSCLIFFSYVYSVVRPQHHTEEETIEQWQSLLPESDI